MLGSYWNEYERRRLFRQRMDTSYLGGSIRPSPSETPEIDEHESNGAPTKAFRIPIRATGRRLRSIHEVPIKHRRHPPDPISSTDLFEPKKSSGRRVRWGGGAVAAIGECPSDGSSFSASVASLSECSSRTSLSDSCAFRSSLVAKIWFWFHRDRVLWCGQVLDGPGCQQPYRLEQAEDGTRAADHLGRLYHQKSLFWSGRVPFHLVNFRFGGVGCWKIGFWLQKHADDKDVMGEVTRTHEAIQCVVDYSFRSWIVFCNPLWVSFEN